MSTEETSVRAPRRTAPGTGQRKKKVDPPPIGEVDTIWGRVEFLTEPDSPFGDGYSITKEQVLILGGHATQPYRIARSVLRNRA